MVCVHFTSGLATLVGGFARLAVLFDELILPVLSVPVPTCDSRLDDFLTVCQAVHKHTGWVQWGKGVLTYTHVHTWAHYLFSHLRFLCSRMMRRKVMKMISTVCLISTTLMSPMTRPALYHHLGIGRKMRKHASRFVTFHPWWVCCTLHVDDDHRLKSINSLSMRRTANTYFPVPGKGSTALLEVAGWGTMPW